MQERKFRITWQFIPNDKTMKTRDGWVRLGIPEVNTYRQTSACRVEGDIETEQVQEVSGSVMKVRWKNKEPFTVIAESTIRPVSRQNFLEKYDPNAVIPEDVKKYLGKTYYVDPTIPRIKSIAQDIKSRSAKDTLENAVDWINSFMTYRVEGVPFKTIDEILTCRTGNCTSYSALFASLCRACGFPTREQWVKISKFKASAYKPGGHSICEVYIPGAGWIHVEQQGTGGGNRGQIGFLPVTYMTLNRYDDTYGQIWGGSEMMLAGNPITEDITAERSKTNSLIKND